MDYNIDMKVVYADILLITNLLFDYILLLLASRLCSQRPSRMRLLFGAVTGSVYALICSMTVDGFFPSGGGKTLFFSLICMAAFYGRPYFARQCAAFAALSAAMGGALWALGLSEGYPLSLYGAFCGIAVALYLLLGNTASPHEAEFLSIELEFLSRRCSLTALRDTGNSLTDPVSGEHVIVVSPRSLRAIVPHCQELFVSEDGIAAIQYFDLFPETRGKFRLIPYSAMGSRGLVPAFRPDKLTINGKEEKYLVAISPRVQGTVYDGIV